MNPKSTSAGSPPTSDLAMLLAIDRLSLMAAWRQLDSALDRGIVIACAIAIVTLTFFLLVIGLHMAKTSMQQAIVAAAWVLIIATSAGRAIEVRRRHVHGGAWLNALPEVHPHSRVEASRRWAMRYRSIASLVTGLCGIVAITLASGRLADLHEISWIVVASAIAALPMPQSSLRDSASKAHGQPSGRLRLWAAIAAWRSGVLDENRRLVRRTLMAFGLQFLGELISELWELPSIAVLSSILIVVWFSLRSASPVFMASRGASVLPSSRARWAKAMLLPTLPGHLLPPLVLFVSSPSAMTVLVAAALVLGSAWSLACRVAYAERPAMATAQHASAAMLLVALGAIGPAVVGFQSLFWIGRLRR